MPRHGHRKQKPRRSDFQDTRPPSQAETLESMLDVLLHVLLCSSCPLCSGSGRVPDGKATEAGRPAAGWTTCSCRRQAWELLREFSLGPLEDAAGSTEEPEGREREDGQWVHGRSR